MAVRMDNEKLDVSVNRQNYIKITGWIKVLQTNWSTWKISLNTRI